jgi:succinate dehydrogenase/fumarate reductase flavoprotein subunit
MSQKDNRGEGPDPGKGVSRRDFLKGAAVGAAAVGVAGVLGACDNPTNTEYVEVPVDWLGPEPQIAESQIAETLSANVVVVGAGLAGVCAARKAREDGASVIVVEKAPQANCRSGEYAVLGSKFNKTHFNRPDVDPDIVADRFMQEGEFRIKRPIISRWAKEAHDVFDDWYLPVLPNLYIAKTSNEDIPDSGKDAYLVPLAHPQPALYDYTQEAFPTFPNSVKFGPSQEPIFKATVDKCVSIGVTFFYDHPGVKLVKTGDRITGVIVQDLVTKQYKQINADRGVILATGDNAGNQEILDYFVPTLKLYGNGNMGLGNDMNGNPINTGDGLKMAAWAGANPQEYHAPMTHHMGNGAMGITPFLVLNRLGKRFMNESVPGQQIQDQLELQPGYKAYQIYDSKWREQLQYMPASHGSVCYYLPKTPVNNSGDLFITDEAFEAALQPGVNWITGQEGPASIQKADTLDELLAKFDIDAAEAKKSIERYNYLAKQNPKKDLDFNKPSQRLFPIENPPYYMSEWGMAMMLVCVGGIESDEEARAYGADGPMKGLYVVGNVQGSRYAVEYPICMRGISHSLCVYYGYVAGKNAAAKLT